MAYWLMKSEPSEYSLTDLSRDGEEIWDGVRNYQARNFLRSMQLGDRVFFYHSNTKPPGIVGLAEISATQIPDPTQFDQNSKYYDEKSTPENPRWHTVKVKFVSEFPAMITLDQLRETFTPEELLVVRKGNRLSVMPVEDAIATRILELTQS
jgi:predicted RNA-binding protein with PUA-like domain